MKLETTILLLIPVLSLLAGVGLFAEHLSVRQWSGCILVMAAAGLAFIARAPIPHGRNVNRSFSAVDRSLNPEQDAPATLDNQQMEKLI